MHIIKPDPSGIPEELRQRPQWVVWRLETRGGKATKIPYSPATGKRASSTDPSTWTDFATAWAAYETGSYSGVGLVFVAGGNLVGVDLDRCRDADTGVIEPWAQEIIERFGGCYVEVSPSGRGVHIIARGTLDPRGRNRSGQVEIYSEGRYFALTGITIEGSVGEIVERQEAVTWIQERLAHKPAPHGEQIGDDEIVANLQKNPQQAAVWAGGHDGYPSASEADLALCSMIARHTHDPSRIDRLFRQSKRMRAKWERNDYRQATIAKALAGGSRSKNGTSGSTDPATVVPITGDAELVVRDARLTRSGKTQATIVARRGAEALAEVVVTGTGHGMSVAANAIAAALLVDKIEVARVLARVMAQASDAARNASPAEGPTIEILVGNEIRERHRFAFRMGRSLYSAAQGREVSIQDVLCLAGGLVDCVRGVAVDAPPTTNLATLLRAVEAAAKVAWGVLLRDLPSLDDSAVEVPAPLADELRGVLVACWHKLEYVAGESSSLASRLLAAAPQAGRSPTTWETIPLAGGDPTTWGTIRADHGRRRAPHLAYWRREEAGRIGLGIGVGLVGQLRVGLPCGVTIDNLGNVGQRAGAIADVDGAVLVLAVEVVDDILRQPHG